MALPKVFTLVPTRSSTRSDGSFYRAFRLLDDALIVRGILAMVFESDNVAEADDVYNGGNNVTITVEDVP